MKRGLLGCFQGGKRWLGLPLVLAVLGFESRASVDVHCRIFSSPEGGSLVRVERTGETSSGVVGTNRATLLEWDSATDRYLPRAQLPFRLTSRLCEVLLPDTSECVVLLNSFALPFETNPKNEDLIVVIRRDGSIARRWSFTEVLAIAGRIELAREKQDWFERAYVRSGETWAMATIVLRRDENSEDRRTSFLELDLRAMSLKSPR